MPIKKIDETIGKIEGYLLTGLLVIMIGFSFYQVFARNLGTLPSLLNQRTFHLLLSLAFLIPLGSWLAKQRERLFLYPVLFLAYCFAVIPFLSYLISLLLFWLAGHQFITASFGNLFSLFTHHWVFRSILSLILMFLSQIWLSKKEGHKLFPLIFFSLLFLALFFSIVPFLSHWLSIPVSALSKFLIEHQVIKPIVWADALVRHLVLWVGFIGASVATQEDGHLAMDLVSRFLPKKVKNSTGFLVQGVCALVCFCLTFASFKFVMGEKEGGGFLLPGIPSYWAVAIIPIGFYLMSIRFARKAWVGLGIAVAIALPLLVFGTSSQIPWWNHFSQKFFDLSALIPTQGPYFYLLCAGIGVIGLLGAPLFIIFGSISLLAFHTAGTDSSATIIEMYRLASAPTLIAIPLFTFAGYLMAESKTPERIVALAKPLFGWMPGGLALMTIVACAFFTAFTGASGVTIIALGGLLYPILLKEKYPDGFSMGLVTTCGSVGLMFPPSLPLILFGLISGASIDKLFLSGLLPGIVIIAILGAYSIFVNRGSSLQQHPFSLKDLKGAVRGAAWEIPLPILILLGIYGGYFTASEAAAVTAFYVFIMEVFIYKDLSLTKDVPRIAKQSMVLVGSIVVIFAVAMGFTSYLIDEQVPMKLFEWIRHYITSRWVFLLVLNIFLLIVGSLMDIFSAIIVVVPLILPIAKEFNVDPLHLGIIFLTNLEIGYLHPPVGLNLFLSSIRFKRSIVNLYWVTLPFLLLLVLALLIITYVPDLSLWMVHHMPTK